MSATKTKAATAAAAETVTEATATATEATHKAAEVSVKNFEKSIAAVREGIEKATKGLETSQAKLKEGVEKAVKTSEELLSFSKGNVEAFVKATQIYATGVQDISKHIAASSKASLEESVAFSKSLLGVKSVKEAVELQTGFTKSSIEKAVAESNKLTDATVKLTEQAIAPITARISLAVETFGKTN
jgi:phasin family protein